MLKRVRPFRFEQGFSLVELMVALVFTSVLMAGMGGVFKTTMGTFMISGEQLATGRRNRMAIEMLYDDLNATGLYLTSMGDYPIRYSAANPGFYILPEMPITGTNMPGIRANSDRLLLCYEEALPFEGTLAEKGSTGLAAGPDGSSAVAGGLTGAIKVSTMDTSIVMKFDDPSYASAVKEMVDRATTNNAPKPIVVFRDGYDAKQIATASVSGSSATITFNQDYQNQTTGGAAGGSGGAFANRHLPGRKALVVNYGQQVCYSIQQKNYDPENPSVGVPCLVREQGYYSETGFTAIPELTAMIAENVSRFKVYLSVDGGITWSGLGNTVSGMTGSDAIFASMNSILATAGRPGVTSTGIHPNWFREIPTLVRVDITTRSPKSLTNYYNSSKPAADQYADPADSALAADQRRYYEETTRTLVLMPRHFGLPY